MNNNFNENENNENENNENKIKEELENQLKFWPEYELCYLFKNKNLTNDKKLLENIFKENSNLHSNYVLKYNTLDNQIIKYNLKHPTWSKTFFNFINDMISINYNSNSNETQYLSDVYDIPLFQSYNIDNDINNDINIDNKNIINQTGNGVCHKTLELYCYFFNNFDFENKINQSLINRIYTNSINTKFFYNCYIFNDEDYLIQDINNFIKHFEFENENEKNLYKKIEIIQSLLCLSNFLDCQLLYSFSISKMITYLKEL